jgi:hypothetical protein
MHLNPNGKETNFSKFILIDICFLVGIKLDLLVHHARIVFNNVKQLFLKRYKVAMLNKRSIVKKISINHVFFFINTIVYSCLRFIVIIWQLIEKRRIKEENIFWLFCLFFFDKEHTSQILFHIRHSIKENNWLLYHQSVLADQDIVQLHVQLMKELN